jgi:hypothetical protein
MRYLIDLFRTFRDEPRTILLALALTLAVGYAAHAGTVTFSEITASTNPKANLNKAPADVSVIEVTLAAGAYGTGYAIPLTMTDSTILTPTNTRCRSPLLSIETAGTQFVGDRYVATYDTDAETLRLYETDDETTGGTTGESDTGTWYDLAEASSTAVIPASTVRLTVYCRRAF